MISWVVATHNLDVLDTTLRPSLALEGDDELVVVEHAPSIAVAYNQGQAKATQPIRCYVHHDVAVLDYGRLRANLVEHCTPDVGVVGVYGSRNPSFPYWEGVLCGSVVDSRKGFGRLGPGDGGPCAYLDGLLLATAQTLEWDEQYQGWHLYDHDICQQMLTRGLTNWCVPDGAELVRHDSEGPRSPRRLTGWDEAVARFGQKWGIHAH